MIKVGNILINPNSIDTIVGTNYTHADINVPETIQIIYNSGVVKNFSIEEIGLPYERFATEFEKAVSKEEDRKILKIMTAVNNKIG